MINHNALQLSHQEYEELYASIMKKIKEPFPEGTVIKKNASDKSAYIPVHTYVKKLNDSAGGYYTWRITTDKPIIHAEQGLLEMRGLLTILNTSNEGQGFQLITFKKGSQVINNFDETIKAATRRALVNAMDMFEAGWVDLAPYREWAKSPGLGLIDNKSEEDDDSANNPDCVSCGCKLTNQEVAIIKGVWNVYYCSAHIPNFVKKKMNEMGG
ncbi:hypothetical protein [Paenibacillus periandrae]|uniref:hypothetical protein n=1 Tax=Paenibacillus periandrae TaxID=1761741 RepID=UPI001F0967E1|nr:hypothetical protein [Paenibacillus periandrae]